MGRGARPGACSIGDDTVRARVAVDAGHVVRYRTEDCEVMLDDNYVALVITVVQQVLH